jgi:hypothetical protein
MKLSLIMGIAVGIALFVITVVTLAIFYYRPTFEWVK